MTPIERLQRLLTAMVVTQGADSEYANDARVGIERYQKMVDTLKVIRIWASVAADRLPRTSADYNELIHIGKEFRNITAKAEEALN